MASTEDTAPKGWFLRVGWLVAAVGLPTAIGATWRQSWAKHPAMAVLLLFVYWLVLVAVRFAGGVVETLTNRWRDRLVEWIDRTSKRRLSGFGTRYINYVLASLRFIDQKGLPTVGFYTPELDEVFVDVSLAKLPPHEVSANPLGDLPAYVKERLSISDFLDHSKPIVLAVTGAPGSGKTTLLRYTARHICRARQGRLRRVPILLYLRDQAKAIVQDGDNGLPSLVRSTLSMHRPEPDGWFEQRLRAGDCVVLLDGLDEVARDEDRRTVSAWVERQIAQYPKNDYVITSRPHGYMSAPIEAATVVQTRRFTEEQVTRFVRRWYMAVERHSTGAEGEDVRLLATSGADDLLERLKGAPALYELTANPLLLTMIANVHRFRGALPGSRVDLYRDICEVMLWRRQEAKKLTAELGGEHKEALLRRLAFAMMQSKVGDVAAADILNFITPGLIRVSRTVSPQEFLDDVASSGLLVEREYGLYSFTHHTFQEYLASTHIRENGLASVLSEAVDDEWWRETTLLYCARANADPIVQACLDSGSVIALTLAFDCADQKAELAPELHHRLNEFLALAYDPNADTGWRRLVTRILITRQLRSVISLANGRHLCKQPINYNIYQLFQRDMSALGENRIPDGPQPSVATEAVTGVRAEDAVAFVGWINAIFDEQKYRLPTHEEMDDLTARLAPGTSARSVWLQRPGHLPERWESGVTEQPYNITASAILEQLRLDVESADLLLLKLLLVRSKAVASLIENALSRTPKDDPRYARCLIRSRDLTNSLGYISELYYDRGSAFSGLDLAFDVAIDHDISSLPLANGLSERLVEDIQFAASLARHSGIAYALDEACDFSRDLSKNFSWHHAHSDTNRALDPSRRLNLIGKSVMGMVLGNSLAYAMHIVRSGESVSAASSGFAQQLQRELRIPMGTYTISIEKLASDVKNRHLLFPAPVYRHLTQWGREISEYLEQSVAPILDREQILDHPSAATIRLTSLCLAAEIISSSGKRGAGELPLAIASGVTLLEQRLCGEHAPTETIILALE